MEYFIGGLIAWIIISWIFFILSETGCIDVFPQDKPLWFLFAPMLVLIIITLPITMYKEMHYKMSNMQFERLKKYNLLYKQISKNWWLCRYYGDKEKHPILYHFIMPVYINVS